MYRNDRLSFAPHSGLTRAAAHAATLSGLLVLMLGGCASPMDDGALARRISDEHAAYLAEARVTSRVDRGDHAPSHAAAAADALPDEPRLDDYLRYAALHNPGLEAAFNRWKAALERVPQATALPDPQLSYAHVIEQIDARGKPEAERYTVSQMFPWFGTLERRGDMATEAAAAAHARFEAQRRTLYFVVRESYFEYYYLSRAIAVVGENRDLVQYLEGVARARFKAAAATHADVIRAQVELGKIEDQLKQLEDLRRPSAAKLNAALNRAPDAPLPWPSAIDESPVTIDEARMRDALRASNPQLVALQHEIAEQRAAIALAGKQRYPDFMLGVEYGDNTSARMSRMDGGGADMLSLMVSINLPLWREKYDAAEREALAQFGAATRSRVDQENALEADLQMALYRYRDAERKIDLFRDTLMPKARESLSATEKSFTAGQSGFTDLIDAQRVLLEFQLSLERAVTDRALSLAQLRMLTGETLEAAAPDAEQPSTPPKEQTHDR